MTTWQEFTTAAPRVSAIFARRHEAAHRLCLLGTNRSDGYPRISPIEPCLFEDRLVICGMQNSRKLLDLDRDPRFTLHTAIGDSHGGDGDAKLWGVVENVQDRRLHRRFQRWVYDDGRGDDLRGLRLARFFVADIEGASAVEDTEHGLKITLWKPGEPERAVSPSY